MKAGAGKVRKKIRSFVRDERGGISKEAVIAIGGILGSAAFAALTSIVTEVDEADACIGYP